MRQPILLDFEGTRPRFGAVSVLLLALGALSVAAVGVLYYQASRHRAGLEYRVAAEIRAKTPKDLSHHDAVADARISKGAEQAAQDLATPWTALLAELEQASKDTHDDVALLGVDPDHAKHSVRISAEARSLDHALAFVIRLQSSHALDSPMLDRHEVRNDDPQHPVHFELTADWKDAT
jgi:hypothetical protein